MTVIPAEIVENIVFTPAERGLIREQAEGMRVDNSALMDAISEGNAAVAIHAFTLMADRMNYLNSILEAKTAQAVRRVQARHNEDDI